MSDLHDICALNDIPDNQAKGLSLDLESGMFEFFVIRKNGNVYGYINRCPHTGVNLDWTPDQFLNNTGDLIQCSTHGAQFRIKDGCCIAGPCAGDHLRAVDVVSENGRIKLIL
ncbi:MAG: Rieske 2Fe-2S domain-containing protein [Gammaproteobacteria bacterium]|nr:Rieske 2Fe-2S domain-containing protein [Gammaproteobacteria bacterium]